MEENKEEQKNIEPVESPTIGKLIMALAKAQGQIKAAHRDSTNPFFKSTYADLASVWDTCREPLAKNGIAVVQRPNPTDGNTVSLTTVLAHESGEWMKGTLVMRPVKNDPQGVGSCLTYARRYALSAMVGICSDEDDDGNSSSLITEGTTKSKSPTMKHNEATQPPPQDPLKKVLPPPLRVTGFIENVNAANAGGYKTYELHKVSQNNGRAKRFATKDPLIIAALDESHAAGNEVSLEYQEIPWKKDDKAGINYAITGLEPGVPFY